MNWFRILLDGIALSTVFNITIALGWVIRPTAYTGMYPRAIQRIASKIKKQIATLSASCSLPFILRCWYG